MVTERQQKAIQLRIQKISYKEIGKRLGGVTAERARQIVLRGIMNMEKDRNRK